MSLCIGGVCIPYSAIVPLCLIGVRWVASKLAMAGLLPDSLAKRLGMSPKLKVGVEEKESCCSKGEAAVRDEGGGKITGRSDSNDTATTTESNGSSSSKEETPSADDIVENIESLERWNQVFASHSSDTNSKLIVKFTAEWCKPCHAIHPCYTSLASKHSKSKSMKFVTLDVDGEECDAVSTQLRIALMPTFVCFKLGNEVGRMSGGNSEEKLVNWVNEMQSV